MSDALALKENLWWMIAISHDKRYIQTNYDSFARTRVNEVMSRRISAELLHHRGGIQPSGDEQTDIETVEQAPTTQREQLNTLTASCFWG